MILYIFLRFSFRDVSVCVVFPLDYRAVLCGKFIYNNYHTAHVRTGRSGVFFVVGIRFGPILRAPKVFSFFFFWGGFFFASLFGVRHFLFYLRYEGRGGKGYFG